MNNPQQDNFEEIQSLCRDFRRQLRSGAQKRIEDYLDRVYDDSREMLFQNLLPIDIEYQRRQGHEPASDDYVARFPQHARLIRQAFFESTMMSMSPEVATPADEDTVLFGMPAARKLGNMNCCGNWDVAGSELFTRQDTFSVAISSHSRRCHRIRMGIHIR
jgi:hypothetical protein